MTDEYDEIEVTLDPDGHYRDATGKVIDPALIVGDDTALAVPEPAATPTANRSKAPKALLAAGAVVVVLIGGSVVYGMHAIGNQATVHDAKAAVSSKTEAVKSSVAVKSSEVLGPSAEEKSDRTGTRVTGAQCMDPAPAIWGGEGDMPDHRLRRESAAELPSAITARVKKRHKDDPSEISIIQAEKSRLGVYASDAAGIYSRAVVSITGGVPVVLNSGATPRVGKDEGACPTLARATTYAVVDGDKEKSVEILATKAVGDTLYGITDDEILELSLEKIEPEPEKEGAASSSAVPGE